MCIIPNPVDLPEPSGASPTYLPQSHLVMGVGRLHPIKGYDLLIAAFAHLSPFYPDWGLVIVGEGSQREILEDIIRTAGLSDRVALPGATSDVATALAAADLFVMSSRSEGFPVALLEAMASGLPAVSFDCPSGPAEIIQHGVNGLLVSPEDVEALAAAMRQLMDSPAERKRLGANARQVRQRFSLDKITDLWLDLIEQVIAEKKR